MGRDVPQDCPLLRRLPHEQKVTVFQITDTAVYDFRGTARGAEGEVLFFHEPDFPPAKGLPVQPE